ncbi:ribosome biogenesis GTP-binding protein YihA/YsxC [Helicobacter sp. MIT 21-1697]|uniref:ribosome biogenesis GTP-binding protein YihA/YsxC n=1 Tax=Helicobacter sp. MIT 21-1697 TaxID=2993733 RepID=UPI00224AAEE1|nr:ribosome biogenesis GTP-binding protein YihA/YsxC [Helicobacter sp. MIT 21-1697]MCX2717222.1 ribosome biogenesis GTP-binding protein YihA/YsxC [Helicobacter sp. MIT 21-1697]
MIQVIESRFVSSASHLDNAPPPNASEVVFLGRSNVGKSTLINALLNKPLAKSSSTPGKTQLINFFASMWIWHNQRLPLTFIDLPGFGYAKVSKNVKKEWEKHLFRFLLMRQSIKLFLHLVDARHTNMAIDLSVATMLAQICRADQCILRIYTKADKLNQSALNALHKRVYIQEDKVQDADTDDMHTHSLLFSAVNKNHRKMASLTHLREEIIKYTLGLENGI